LRAALYDQPSGRIAIYYGGADTVTALAFAKMDEALEFLRTNAEI
jgi:beta-1,4-mannooligosaccharide/beta-1,4-mannosyl-N-acetylglucosamine phosphorylase